MVFSWCNILKLKLFASSKASKSYDELKSEEHDRHIKCPFLRKLQETKLNCNDEEFNRSSECVCELCLMESEKCSKYHQNCLLCRNNLKNSKYLSNCLNDQCIECIYAKMMMINNQKFLLKGRVKTKNFDDFYSDPKLICEIGRNLINSRNFNDNNDSRFYDRTNHNHNQSQCMIVA